LDIIARTSLAIGITLIAATVIIASIRAIRDIPLITCAGNGAKMLLSAYTLARIWHTIIAESRSIAAVLTICSRIPAITRRSRYTSVAIAASTLLGMWRTLVAISVVTSVGTGRICAPVVISAAGIAVFGDVAIAAIGSRCALIAQGIATTVTTDFDSYTAACIIDRSIAQIAIIIVAVVLTSRVAVMTSAIGVIATDIATMYTGILASTFAIDTTR
jgi:hypothetical protein